MAEELVMPRLSDTMEQGTVARWLKQEGDEVHAGDVVAEIETDKATMEYQSDLDGVLLKILVGDGQTAPLGAPIAYVGQTGEEVPSGDAAAPPAVAEPSNGATAAAPATDAPALRAPTTASVAGAPVPLKASPVARRMAEEAGLDLRELAGRGSGPDGRIVRTDVERLLERRDRRDELPVAPASAAAAAPLTDEATVAGATSMQRTIARRMLESKTTVPHFYLRSAIEMTRTLEVRRELNETLEAAGEKVSVTDMIVRAAGVALMEHPQFHRSYVDDTLVQHAHANVGIAVALDDGLIVPVIRAVETRTLRDVARTAADLVDRARSGRLKQPEIEGGTFTISNLGMLGIDEFAAIINPPEPGILAIGATVDQPVVRDGSVVVRPIMQVTLSVDHRATSGADAARFLGRFRELLEKPLALIG